MKFQTILATLFLNSSIWAFRIHPETPSGIYIHRNGKNIWIADIPHPADLKRTKTFNKKVGPRAIGGMENYPDFLMDLEIRDAVLDDDEVDHTDQINVLSRGLINYTSPDQFFDNTDKKYHAEGSCGCGSAGMTSLDYLSATTGLKALCSKTSNGNYPEFGANDHGFVVSGGAVAYMCNYSGGGNPCADHEIDLAFAVWQRKCASSQAAWAFFNNWLKAYGIDTASASLCSG